MKTVAIVSLLLLSVFFIGNTFANEKFRSIDYQEINSLLRYIKENTHSPYIVTDQKVSIKADNLAFSDVKLWLTTEGTDKQEISINPDGTISLPIFSNDVAKISTLDINQEKGAVSISLTAGVGELKEKEVSYSDLFILLEDTNNFISEMGGAAAWFAPNMDALSFTFDQPANITISSKKKKYFYKTDDDYNIQIGIKRKLMKENPRVLFSLLPIEMSPKD